MADWLTTWSVWHWLVLGFVLLIAETILLESRNPLFKKINLFRDK